MTRRHTWLAAIIIALMAVTLAACDDLPADNPRSTILPGTWYYDGSSGSPGYWGNSQFTFYNNGTGYYYGEDQQGYTDTWYITWQSYGGRQLSVWFQDGTTWNFDYSLNGYGELQLSPWEAPSVTLYYTRR